MNIMNIEVSGRVMDGRKTVVRKCSENVRKLKNVENELDKKQSCVI